MLKRYLVASYLQRRSPSELVSTRRCFESFQHHVETLDFSSLSLIGSALLRCCTRPLQQLEGSRLLCRLSCHKRMN